MKTLRVSISTSLPVHSEKLPNKIESPPFSFFFFRDRQYLKSKCERFCYVVNKRRGYKPLKRIPGTVREVVNFGSCIRTNLLPVFNVLQFQRESGRLENRFST